MSIGIDGEKVFDEIQHPLVIKTLSKLVIEGNFPNLIKIIYQRPTDKIFIDEKHEASPLRSGAKQGYLLLPPFFNAILDILANAVGQEKQ